MAINSKKHFDLLKIEKADDKPVLPELEVVPRPDANGFLDIVIKEVAVALSEEDTCKTRTEVLEPSTQSAPQTVTPVSPPRGWAERMKGAKAVGSVATALGDLRDHNNAEVTALRRQLTEGQTIVELDADKIDRSFVSDRMDISDEATEKLKDLIREQGQLVPILARPHPSSEGRYQVAFGHRRLRAARELGIKVRAIVREMTDEELIIAQGQENNARLDLTYIERARFASTLLKMKFSRKAVEQALSVNHSQVVWFKQVTDGIADEILTAIGRAPKIGRPRWMQLVETLAQPGRAKRAAHIIRSDQFLSRPSEQRFAFLLGELAEKKKAGPEQEIWMDPAGRKLASFTYSEAKCIVEIDRRDDPDFAKFLFSRLDSIYQDYSASKKIPN